MHGASTVLSGTSDTERSLGDNQGKGGVTAYGLVKYGADLRRR